MAGLSVLADPPRLPQTSKSKPLSKALGYSALENARATTMPESYFLLMIVLPQNAVELNLNGGGDELEVKTQTQRASCTGSIFDLNSSGWC